jgi:thiamine biosynthesis lipoprotein
MAEPVRRCRPLLGTFVEVTADREDAIEVAFGAIGQVHRLMSAHEPDSDISRINRFGHVRAVKVHEWTARVIERALSWSKRSEGVFDIVAAGKAAIERGLLPRHADQPLPETAHWTWLEVQGACVRLLKPGCIDVGGIAKGFAVDRAVEALRSAGATLGLVNAGGDLFGFGSDPWPVTVIDPRRQAIVHTELQDSALATSAGLVAENGALRFDHVTETDRRWTSVSVRAPTCCDADALAKIVWSSRANTAALLASADADAFALTANGTVERPWNCEGAAA